MSEVVVGTGDKELAFFKEFRDFVLDVLDCIDVRFIFGFLVRKFT